MCDNELVVGSAMCRDEGNGPINAAEMSLDVGIYGGKQRANLTLVENNFVSSCSLTCKMTKVWY